MAKKNEQVQQSKTAKKSNAKTEGKETPKASKPEQVQPTEKLKISPSKDTKPNVFDGYDLEELAGKSFYYDKDGKDQKEGVIVDATSCNDEEDPSVEVRFYDAQNGSWNPKTNNLKPDRYSKITPVAW